MSRARTLERKLRALRTLEEAVGALRSLSAQHFRAARTLLPAARLYREEITALLGVLREPALATPPGPPAPAGIVLVTADLGLIGDYTGRLVREVVSLRRELGAGPLLCLGRRAAAPLAREGIHADRVDPAPTGVTGLSRLLLPLVDEILQLRTASRVGAFWLVAARFEGVGHFRPVRVPLLPVAPPPDAAPLAVSPYSAPGPLRFVAIREYLVAALYETLVEAIASEHAKRLVTAESARAWLVERIDEVGRRLGSIRRESATQEVLEIAGAARSARRFAREERP